jgi:DNA-binding MarR family transcriptional regulator
VQKIVPDAEQLTDELFGFLTYIIKNAESDVFRVAAELDLSLSQLRGLFVLGHAEHELGLSELAEHVGLSVAATGRAVDVLVRHGLVARHEDAADRRIKRIVLTDSGRETLIRLAAARRDGLRQFVDTLDGEQRDRFSQALRPVLERPEVRNLCQELSR